MTGKDVLVLGAGVSGLTTAYELLKAGYSVTVWCKEPSGFLAVTSSNAYAFWLPVKADADARVERWADETFDQLEELSHRAQTGIVMRPSFELKVRMEEPWYAGKLRTFRHARAGEISEQYADAHVIERIPVIDPPVYLRWLCTQVKALGGKIRRHEITSLTKCPKRYDTIVNCTGLAARELVGDSDLSAARLQVLTLKANGFDKVMFDSEGPNRLACLVPHADHIKVGALYDEGDESLDVSDEITEGILKRCKQVAPGFNFDKGNVLKVTRCLRPKRSVIRVESERLDARRFVVHNYGHNGTGYIVSFGAAREVVKLIELIAC